MEELLNKLIEKGWKPFGRNYYKYENGCLYYTVHTKDGVWSEGRYGISLRELVSIESGLWQFVCENEMQNMIEEHREGYCSNEDYGYRLIESALCDEDKLEQFLLDNIKIDE